MTPAEHSAENLREGIATLEAQLACKRILLEQVEDELRVEEIRDEELRRRTVVPVYTGVVDATH